MIRRKLSSGLLRAATPAPPAASPLCPPSPGRVKARGLASAVLLSSQRNWKGETVVALKAELKKRGLSQQGNKASLVARLESAETSSLLGPLPPFPNTTRSLSTSASLSQPPKKDSHAAFAVEKSAPQPKVTTTGAEVSSEKHEMSSAPRTDSKVDPDTVTVAPGLPQTKDVDAGVTGEKLDLKFPKPQAREEIDQVIPLTPDNFAAKSTEASSSTEATSEPKVLTVAGASTHLSGGPQHATHDLTEKESDSMPSVKDIPGLVEVLTSVVGSPVRAFNSIGVRMPEVHMPKMEGGGEYKREQRGLNDQERRGAWVLAGVVGLGFFLGGGKKDKKDKAGKGMMDGAMDQAHDLADKAKGVKTVKGDAAWEKASGAGVVGHGHRKD
ncbi:hypothetical protein IAU60_003428 [Kwoniella sp. DSM 27419]